MTAPGDGFGEGGHHEKADRPAAGGDAADQPDATAPWEPPTYGPPGYPGGYYPTPDYQGGYGPPGPHRAGTNGLAIASLIAAFTGLLCGIGSIVGIVLGAIALDQIKRTRQDGFGLAVAGIVIGIATLVVILVIVIFRLHAL
ncbi:DUF4190 domain-containing protein [Mycobacterium colombiense]|uniref:DUF4190 domain-containing protein n=1 Tax=Mycobacterium colombiense TaxID=339268 RepID=UPI0009D6D5D1